MKKISKKFSKRGFTLLEVMLATVIMTIVSTMIMKGFLSTMNYAHNNNVYSKMGAQNYQNALGQVTNMVGYGKGDGLQNRINYLKTSGTAAEMNCNIQAGGAGVGSLKVNIKHWEYDSITGVNIAGAYAEASSVSHRHSFFFQPTTITCPAAPTGDHKVRYCVVPADASKNGWYCKQPGCTYADKIA